MRRLCLIFLLVILPVQFSWSAAAVYCQHEEPQAANWHFGHHQHHHQSDAKAEHDKKTVIDTDCGICHLACSPVAYGHPPSLDASEGAQSAPISRELKLTSSRTRTPDRPQWCRLT
ncbi:cation efflux protein, CzcI family [Ralstonia pickettii]|uniref:cation efflux protein, CzcI family n=1 Tax=Ralstonia pickettii TaxID=329 RepID=UPI003465425D